MQYPLSRRTTLRIIQFLSVLFTAYIFYSLHQLKPPIRYVNTHGKPGDNATLMLNRTLAQRLKNEHNLDPIKSRGATIFLDKDDVIRIPPNYVLDVMEFRDLEETFDRYLGSIQTICKRKVHLGDVVEGGYDVCEDVKVRPIPPCLTYSFSSTGDYSFEEIIAETYNCDVHVFIPNAGKGKSPTSSLHFHNITQFHGANLANVVDVGGAPDPGPIIPTERVAVLKVDLAGGEWSALAQMLTGLVLQEVDQLIVRFHSYSLDRRRPRPVDHRNKLAYRRHLSVLRTLYDREFRIFYHRRVTTSACVFVDEMNTSRTGCHEVSMVKVR